MSENLDNFEYQELNINTVDLYNYFVQNNYSYSDIYTNSESDNEDTPNYRQYTATFITNQLNTLINDVSVNFTLIENILTQWLNDQTSFTDFFKSSDNSPFYTYTDNPNESSFLIAINEASVQTNYLIKIHYEEIDIPIVEDNTTVDNTNTNNISNNNISDTNTCNISESTTCAFFNNDILFAKSLNAGSNIFEQINKKNIWSLVTLVNDLDIKYTTSSNCNIIVQITAGITITSNLTNSYSWGLFNVDTQNIDKSSMVISNSSCSATNSYNSIKSIFFHIGVPSAGTYNYKWIQKDENGLNNIKIDSSYPVTIIAWKIQNQINDINISYMQHLSQKINDLQIAYNQLASKVNAL